MLTVVESGEIKEIMHNVKFPKVLGIHKTQFLYSIPDRPTRRQNPFKHTNKIHHRTNYEHEHEHVEII